MCSLLLASSEYKDACIVVYTSTATRYYAISFVMKLLLEGEKFNLSYYSTCCDTLLECLGMSLRFATSCDISECYLMVIFSPLFEQYSIHAVFVVLKVEGNQIASI